MHNIEEVYIKYYSIPFKKPFKMIDTIMNHKKGFLLIVKTEAGIKVGDCSPLIGFSKESFAEAQAQLLIVYSKIQALIKTDLSEAITLILEEMELLPSVEFALKSLEYENVISNNIAGIIRSNALINMHDIDKEIKDKYSEGYRIFKIKLGRSEFNTELSYWSKYVSEFSEKVKFIFDTNRTWSLDQLDLFYKSIDKKSLLYFEDPLECKEELISLLSSSRKIPIALDESLIYILDKQIYSFKYAVIKPTIVSKYDRIIKLLNNKNKKVVLSSAFESFYGIRNLCFLHKKYNLDTHIGLDTYKVYNSDFANMDTFIDQSIVNIDLLLQHKTHSEHICVVDLHSHQK